MGTQYYLNLTDADGVLIDRWVIETDPAKLDANLKSEDEEHCLSDAKDFGPDVKDAIAFHQRSKA